MATSPREPVSAGSSLTSAWWRFPIYDPGPPWWFENVGEELQKQLALEQIQTMREHLQTQMKSLERQAEILSKKR